MSLQQGPFDLSLLRGSVAVVTGAANGGIGYGICERAAELGMDVALLDVHENVVREATAALVRGNAGAGVRFAGIRCDVTKPGDLATAVKAVQKQFGADKRVGAVFANAGVLFWGKGVVGSSIEDWRTTFDVNVLGVVNTVQAFVPLMKQSLEPSVVCNVASLGGLARVASSMAAYGASKHAVVALTEALSMELANRHPQIRVHVCCPCLVKTDLERTSQMNQTARQGEAVQRFQTSLIGADGDNVPPSIADFMMTPKGHAIQVWDRIAAGEFYMITENIRPYVNHDFPFGAADAVATRFAAVQKPDFQRSIDNGKQATGPLIRELGRRTRDWKRSRKENGRDVKTQPAAKL